MPKQCKNYQTKKHPVSEECESRHGIYEDHEIADNFWVDKHMADNFWAVCKHCKWVERNTPEQSDKPLTTGWPRDDNGRLLSYWNIIENDIILKVDE